MGGATSTPQTVGNERMPADAMKLSAAPTTRLEPQTTTTIAPRNMIAASTDEQYRAAKAEFFGQKVCIQYSSAFCDKCHSMLPHFMKGSQQFPDVKYILCQIDHFTEEGTDIRYLPLYRFYNAKGQKVDEFFGVKPQKLEDHLWLHSDAAFTTPLSTTDVPSLKQ